MKTVILAAIAASVVAAPVAAEAAAPQTRQVVKVKQNRHATIVTKRVVRQQPVSYRKWQRGQRFDARYARNYRQVDYRYNRNLYRPPAGYRWVQSNNDAVLVSIASGLIGAVIGGVLAN